MVQTKHQKSKQHKKQHPHPHHMKKKQGKQQQADISEFRAQLDALGLKIIQVTADGNCFFRALADQLQGTEDKPEELRSMVVQYILKNREMFEPFIEDEVPFDEYCQSMEKDGTWAGHMELQAASLVTHSNICIHRNLSPRWYIQNFDDHRARMIHLSYHDGEHYNSVRLKEDPCDGPARPITIKADADLSTTSHQPKVAVSKSKEGPGQTIDAGSIKLVMAGTACSNAEKVVQVLHELDGDVNAAIEFLVAEQGIEECLVENDKVSQLETSCGGNQNGNVEPRELENDIDGQALSTNSIKSTPNDRKPQKDDKKIPRNKVCSCGSRKKYKACCGSVAGKSSTKFAVNHALDSSKSQRERKQGKKGKLAKGAPVYDYRDNGVPPDMGALCI